MGASITRRRWFALAEVLVSPLIWGALLVASCNGDSSSPSEPDASPMDLDASIGFDSATQDSTTGCPNAQTSCSDGCTNLAEDVSHCGSCSNACAAGQVCSQGACALSCGGGTTKCAAVCVDTNLDPANCGTCGTTCNAGLVCSSGACATGCTGGLATCGGGDAGVRYCASTATDNANCGSCGKTCAAGTACKAGACATTCGGGETVCAPDSGIPYCANLKADPANCGTCGNACASGMACGGASGCVGSCPGAQIDCNGGCVDPSSNSQHCGATAGCGVNDAGSPGVVCGNGMVCATGTCSVSCPGTQINCNGACVDPVSNNQHCGATAGCGAGDTGSPGTVCGNGMVCNAGTCSVSCPGTQIDCNGGCVDPMSSNQFCGATAGCGASDAGSPGTACGSGYVCAAGTCSVSCPGAQINCNGGCVDPSSNNQFCGATTGCGDNDAGSPGTACGSGSVCAAGTCSVSCPAAQINCNGGCVDPTTNNQFCGATPGCGGNDAGSPGTACGSGSVCAAGTCSVSCPAAQIDCNGACVDPVTNNQFCGATPGCGDNDAGSPGIACGNGLVCSLGACTATCAAPLSDCNNSCVDERNDPQHCGSCSPCFAVTPANETAPVCQSSVCRPTSCLAGFANCNGDQVDGCEVSTGADTNNCGTCGHVCPAAAPHCAAGACSCLPLGGTPLAPCSLGNDPETGSQWVVCTASCNQAWLSISNRNGGQYHALQICNLLGYRSVGGWDGNFGTVCGYNQGTGSCASPQTSSFIRPISAPDDGSDQFGPIIAQTVQWQCLP